MRLKVLGLGVRYPGRCPICGQMTRSQDWAMREKTVLLRGDGRYYAAHLECVGGKVRHRVRGDTEYLGPSYVDVDE